MLQGQGAAAARSMKTKACGGPSGPAASVASFGLLLVPAAAVLARCLYCLCTLHCYLRSRLTATKTIKNIELQLLYYRYSFLY